MRGSPKLRSVSVNLGKKLLVCDNIVAKPSTEENLSLNISFSRLKKVHLYVIYVEKPPPLHVRPTRKTISKVKLERKIEKDVILTTSHLFVNIAERALHGSVTCTLMSVFTLEIYHLYATNVVKVSHEVIFLPIMSVSTLGRNHLFVTIVGKPLH